MKASDVQSLLDRYRQVVKGQVKTMRGVRARVLETGGPLLSDEARDLSDALLTSARLEIEKINEAVEWLNNIQD